MKNNFIIKSINSPFEDSVFFVRNVYKKSAFLMDCGRIGNISNSELLSITDVFVSHTHMDHFYGFDRLLRGFIRADKRIRFFGPPGFIDNVKGKLAGYTWNLIKSYTLVIEVWELLSDIINVAVFEARKGFVPYQYTVEKSSIDLHDGFTLEYEFFDHGTISVGYRIKEPVHINIKKGAMEAYDYKKGPWVTELKNNLREKKKVGKINVETKNGVVLKDISELEEELIIYSPPQDITYITDVAPTFENYKKALDFAFESYILFIEGMFLKEDVLHAIDKKHLTIDMAKNIFSMTRTRYVHFFHFAPKYEQIKNIFFERLYKEIHHRII